MVDRGQALLVVQGLHVVEHDQDLFSGGGDPVHQRVDGALDGATGVSQPLESVAPDAFVGPFDGGATYVHSRTGCCRRCRA